MGRRRKSPVKVYRPKTRGRVSPFWFCDFTTPGGQRVRQSTGCTEHAAALRIATEWYRAAQHEHADAVAGVERPSGVSILTLADEFISAARHEKAARYVDRHEDWLRVYILPFFGQDTPAAAITQDQVKALRRAILSGALASQRPARRRTGLPSAATCNRILTTLRRLLNFGVETGHVKQNAATGIGRLRERPEEKFRALADDEIEKWLTELAASASPAAAQHCAWVRFLVETGIRDDEAALIQRTQIDWAHGRLRLHADQTKAGKARDVPLTKRAFAILADMGVAPGQVGAVFGKVSRRGALAGAWERTGLPGRSPTAHDLRNTAASRAAASGLDLVQMMDYFGWESPATAARYLKMFGNRWQDMAAKLDRGPA